MLKNEVLDVQKLDDTAENEPLQISKIRKKCDQSPKSVIDVQGQIQYTIYNIQYTIYNIQYTIYNI